MHACVHWTPARPQPLTACDPTLCAQRRVRAAQRLLRAVLLPLLARRQAQVRPQLVLHPQHVAPDVARDDRRAEVPLYVAARGGALGGRLSRPAEHLHSAGRGAAAQHMQPSQRLRVRGACCLLNAPRMAASHQ